MRFVKSCANSLLFIKHSFLSILYFLIYIGDIILIGSHEDKVHNLISTFHAQFSFQIFGFTYLFLGIEVKRLVDGNLLLSKAKHVIDLLIKTIMLESKASTTSMSTTKSFSVFKGDLILILHIIQVW